MTVRRLHAPDLPDRGGPVALGEEAAHHARVLRLAKGQRVELFDGMGRRCVGTVTRIEPRGLVVEAEAPTRDQVVLGEVELLVGLPKAPALESGLRMATEAGVRRVRLVDAERSVPRLSPDKEAKRLERLQRIVGEAARQCERDTLPEIVAPRPLRDVVADLPKGGSRFVCDAREGRALPVVEAAPSIVAVGPEGGFSASELGLLSGAGFLPVRLGAHVMRVETAIVVAVALISARFAPSR